MDTSREEKVARGRDRLAAFRAQRSQAAHQALGEGNNQNTSTFTVSVPTPAFVSGQDATQQVSLEQPPESVQVGSNFQSYDDSGLDELVQAGNTLNLPVIEDWTMTSFQGTEGQLTTQFHNLNLQPTDLNVHQDIQLSQPVHSQPAEVLVHENVPLDTPVYEPMVQQYGTAHVDNGAQAILQDLEGTVENHISPSAPPANDVAHVEPTETVQEEVPKAQLLERIQQLETEKTQLLRRAEAAEKASRDLSSRMTGEIQQLRSELGSRTSMSNDQDLAKDAQLKEMKLQLEQARHELELAKAEHEALEDRNRMIVEKVEKVKPTIDVLRQQLAEKDAQIQHLQSGTPDLQFLQTQLTEATTRLQELRQEKDQATAKLAGVQDQLSSQQETNRQLVEDLRELTESLAEQKRERKMALAMQDSVDTSHFQQEIARLQQEVNMYANRVEQLEREKQKGSENRVDLSQDLQVLDAILAKRGAVMEKIAGLKRQILSNIQ